MTRFLRTWRALASKGFCDGEGSREFFPIRKQWIADGMPADVENYIKKRANMLPFLDLLPPELDSRGVTE
jgi:hypothetical protein